MMSALGASVRASFAFDKEIVSTVLDEALQIGAVSVVNKPFEMRDLPTLVERALAGRPR